MLHRMGLLPFKNAYGLIYAFKPIVTGFPSTIAVVTAFPLVLATTSVLPDADGVGFSRSISMQSLLPLISTVIAIGVPLYFQDSGITVQGIESVPIFKEAPDRLKCTVSLFGNVL